jgi:hypothetical protein
LFGPSLTEESLNVYIPKAQKLKKAFQAKLQLLPRKYSKDLVILELL